MYPFFLETLGGVVDYQAGCEWPADKLKEEIAKRIRFYYERGIIAREYIIIVHGNNAYFFADILALWFLGACCVCVDPDIGYAEFSAIAKFCNIRFAIYYKAVGQKLSGNATHVTFIDTAEVAASQAKISPGEGSFYQRIDSDAPALILFTSGTTGIPKGVVHSFRTLLAKWTILSQYVPLQHMEVSLCLLPTHFGHGLICNCLYPLISGKKLIILPKFNLEVLMRLGGIVDEHEVTYMSSVPSVWTSAAQLSKPPSKNTLRLVTCGSAPLSSALWSRMQEWTGISRVWNTYGITETASWIAGTGKDAVIPRDGFIGRGWGTNILITRREGGENFSLDGGEDSARVLPGEIGYVWLQTPTLMQGYLNQPGLTASVVSGTWFYTGDLGYLTKDGELVLTGRVRNEINFAGIKVTPEDVDLILERHEAISACCTFGMNDDLSGEIVAAAVVFKENKNRPSSSELKRWLSHYISDYKIPRLWYEAENIPVSARGKVNRAQLAEYYKNKLPLR